MRILIAALIAVIIYKIQDEIMKLMWCRNLKVQIAFDKKEVTIGECTRLIANVENRKWLTIPFLILKLSLPSNFHFLDEQTVIVGKKQYKSIPFVLPGWKRVRREYSFEATKRGYVKLSNYEMTSFDFFGVSKYAKRYTSDNYLYVLPNSFRDPQIKIFYQSYLGELRNRNSLLESPYSFCGIREYSYGDAFKEINWKTSAKQNQLCVNIKERTASLETHILLNLEPPHMVHPEYISEISISIVCALIYYFDDHQISFQSNGLDAISNCCETVALGVGSGQQKKIAHTLARLTKSAGLNAFLSLIDQIASTKQNGKSYIVVSAYHKQPLFERLDKLCESGVMVKCIVPVYDFEDTKKERDYIDFIRIKES